MEPKLLKNSIFGPRKTKEHNHLIQHIQISLNTQFNLKQTVLIFWTKFA